VLDVGCGPARLLMRFAHDYPEAWFVGLDIIRYVAGPADPGNMKVICGDGRTIPDAATFDRAYSVLTFQHLPPVAVRGYIAQMALVRRRVVFQFVEGTTHIPFEHKYEIEEVLDWCSEVGINPLDVTRDARYDEWVWVAGRTSR
jgi:SAM-dependent methyltransferase